MFLVLLPFIGVKANEYKSLELPRIKVVPIQDSLSGRQYELYIKLPEGYPENKDKKYPVLYTTDAMWHIEILSAATEFLLEETILVGISWQKNTENAEEHYSRFRDYTFTKSKSAKNPTGEASNHLTFIRNDVFKFVENHYRTAPNQRTYFGYSLGGAFGSYILLTQPDTFENYILGSPAFGSKDMHVINELKYNAASKKKGLNANVFISYGSLEKKLGTNVDRFLSKLKSRNDESLLLQFEVIESADHGKAFPMTTIRSLNWLSSLTK